MKIKILFLLLFISTKLLAQTNTFPANGNVGIGTTTPGEKLDVVGDIYLRNMLNTPGAGTSITFSSFSNDNFGPKIYSYLDYAEGVSSKSRLILSSYNNGYHNELTLANGNVGIGTINPNEKLTVNGKIRAKEIKVEVDNWPDYVFNDSYKLGSLKELELYVKSYKHLPEVPSALKVLENGIELGELNKILLKKIEELTLHLIEQEKRSESQLQKIMEFEKRLVNIESK